MLRTRVFYAHLRAPSHPKQIPIHGYSPWTDLHGIFTHSSVSCNLHANLPSWNITCSHGRSYYVSWTNEMNLRISLCPMLQIKINAEWDISNYLVLSLSFPEQALSRCLGNVTIISMAVARKLAIIIITDSTHGHTWTTWNWKSRPLYDRFILYATPPLNNESHTDETRQCNWHQCPN